LYSELPNRPDNFLSQPTALIYEIGGKLPSREYTSAMDWLKGKGFLRFKVSQIFSRNNSISG